MDRDGIGRRVAIGAALLVTCVGVPGCRADTRAAGRGAAGEASVIQNTGSDTMLNLALAWTEAYAAAHPATAVVVTGGGSGTGIAGLLNRTVDIANASRALKPDEIAQAKAVGFTPFPRSVAVDALAVIVNPANPVQRLTIAQLADIYTGRVNNWSQVGGLDAPIVRVSRETNSGTHVYFLEEVVRQGDGENTDIFAPDTLLMPSSVGITSEVRRNPNAIGYDGLGYVDPDHEKMLALAETAGGPFVAPTVGSAADGSYPLARPLYMITAGAPRGAIDAYMDWILGPEGQAIVARLGFVPVPQP